MGDPDSYRRFAEPWARRRLWLQACSLVHYVMDVFTAHISVSDRSTLFRNEPDY